LKIFRNITFWVLLSIAAGIAVGILDPVHAMRLEFLGKDFIGIVKLFIYPIIFFTMTLGIAAMDDIKKVGKTGGKALLYFEVVTTAALIIGICISYVFQPGNGVDISQASHADVSKYEKGAHDFSWKIFFLNNITLQVLLFAIVVGFVTGRLSQKKRIITILTTLSSYVFKALHFVMYLAPIGAFGGMAYTVGKFGPGTLLSLAKLMASVYATMLIFIFGILGLILWTYRISILKFLRHIRDEILIVLGTSSSEAGLPSLMEKLECMGCPKSIVGLVIPAGYSFNLDGTTIYLSMAVIFLSQAFHVHLTFEQIITIIGILMITSKGAAGVTGSGFVVLASTLQAVHAIPVEGLALLIGVDRFMSEARAITNLIGNGVATVWISNNEKMFDREAMNRAFQKRPQRP